MMIENMRDTHIHEDDGFSSEANLEFRLEREVKEAFFQFDDEEPVKFANVLGNTLTLSLGDSNGKTENPSIEFTDGKGRTFKLYLA